MSNVYHIDPEAYERHTLEELEQAAVEREIFEGTLEALWDIALTHVKTNKLVEMSDGSSCCPHCGKTVDVEQWWEAQDREMSDV